MYTAEANLCFWVVTEQLKGSWLSHENWLQVEHT